MTGKAHQAEAAISIVTIACAALFIWDSRRYPVSPFEPIGSGAVPAGVAVIALVLATIMLVQAVRGLAATRGAPVETDLGWRVLATFALTIAYTAVLASGWVRYAIATAAFMLLGVMLIAEQPRKILPWTIVVSLVFAIGLDLVFRHIFVTDIP